MKRRTVDFQIPLTNKVLAIDDEIAFPIFMIVLFTVPILSIALLGLNVTLVLGLLLSGYIIIPGINIKDKPEE